MDDASGGRGAAPSVRVWVDPARCQGHNRCHALAPEVFVVDELGNAEVVGDGRVSGPSVARARLAERNCPEQAVLVSDEG